MPTEQEEALYWAGKASDAHRNVQDTVQTSAGKWQAAIAAFLGAYATVGFVVGPTTLASHPPSGWKVAIVIILGLAGLIGLCAVILANRAAAGFPRIVDPARKWPRPHWMERGSPVSTCAQPYGLPRLADSGGRRNDYRGDFMRRILRASPAAGSHFTYPVRPAVYMISTPAYGAGIRELGGFMDHLIPMGNWR